MTETITAISGVARILAPARRGSRSRNSADLVALDRPPRRHVGLDEEAARLRESEDRVPLLDRHRPEPAVDEHEPEGAASSQLLEAVPLEQLDVLQAARRSRATAARSGSSSTVTTERAVSAMTAAVSP
ncbi:MAG TPA: hypothetical protein VKO84_03135 [Gaiellaceae bacterium]|nr:hypothetical protein [Gaiellaceae bacterium]